MALLLLFTTMATDAQTEKNPKGLYRLKQFIYEDGRTSPPGFSQYKYAADSVGLLISYRASQNTTQWSNMTVEIREPYPLLYTGEKPQGTDGHGTQIFNVDDDQFCFKWYNDKWPNMSKLNEFITEVYRKSVMEPEVTQAINMLENRFDYNASKFYGWWVRVAATANPDGTGKRTAVPTIWKAYSPGLSMVVTILNNGNVLGCNPTSTVKYENDSTIYEIGHPCNIYWINDNCHTLTFVQENGAPLTELWMRSGLPRNWQSVFNTDVAMYKNGTECIKEAVETALAGNLQQAEALIAEAMNEKDVNISILCAGTAGIASDLLNTKQQYKDCVAFCERQLKNIRDYVDAGHDHAGSSRVFIHQTEIFRAVATYRNGETEKGRQLMEERLSIIESEIEQYRAVKGMESYINTLYYCNLVMYNLGYDVFGADRTLLYLDALSLMAPAMTAQQKPMILQCRANCYLLKGDKESADKLLQQAKELAP